MANRYFKSLIWLVGCSGLGYILYVACTPNEMQTNELRKVCFK